MSWNYRLVTLSDGCNCGYTTTGIYEVYYDEKGLPWMRTVNPIIMMGEDSISLYSEYKMISEAFSKEILTEEDFPNG